MLVAGAAATVSGRRGALLRAGAAKSSRLVAELPSGAELTARRPSGRRRLSYSSGLREEDAVPSKLPTPQTRRRTRASSLRRGRSPRRGVRSRGVQSPGRSHTQVRETLKAPDGTPRARVETAAGQEGFVSSKLLSAAAGVAGATANVAGAGISPKVHRAVAAAGAPARAAARAPVRVLAIHGGGASAGVMEYRFPSGKLVRWACLCSALQEHASSRPAPPLAVQRRENDRRRSSSLAETRSTQVPDAAAPESPRQEGRFRLRTRPRGDYVAAPSKDAARSAFRNVPSKVRRRGLA